MKVFRKIGILLFTAWTQYWACMGFINLAHVGIKLHSNNVAAIVLVFSQNCVSFLLISRIYWNYSVLTIIQILLANKIYKSKNLSGDQTMKTSVISAFIGVSNIPVRFNSSWVFDSFSVISDTYSILSVNVVKRFLLNNLKLIYTQAPCDFLYGWVNLTHTHELIWLTREIDSLVGSSVTHTVLAVLDIYYY